MNDASPFVTRVQIVLNLKSIEYEFIDENLACKSELLLKLNPVHKRVPVLFDANKPPVCESLIILEYLDETKPNVHRILLPDPSDRAEIRFWANYMDNKYLSLFKKLWGTPKEGKEALIKKIIEGSCLMEEVFVKFSNGKGYFGGDDIGYLDVVLGCFLGWIKFHEKLDEFIVFDEDRTPGLAKWAKCMWSHEAIKNVIPGNEIFMNFYMNMMS